MRDDVFECVDSVEGSVKDWAGCNNTDVANTNADSKPRLVGECGDTIFMLAVCVRCFK